MGMVDFPVSGNISCGLHWEIFPTISRMQELTWYRKSKKENVDNGVISEVP